MDQLAVHEARVEVRRRADLSRSTGIATLISVGSVLGSLAIAPDLAAALAIATLVCAVGAGLAWAARQQLIERLAIDLDAHSIPEVSRYGRRLADHSERKRLAESIDSLVGKPGPCAIALKERVDPLADEFSMLAEELRSAETKISSASVAICRRLITRAPSSPLYNHRLPADDLTAALRRIRSGIGEP